MWQYFVKTSCFNKFVTAVVAVVMGIASVIGIDSVSVIVGVLIIVSLIIICSVSIIVVDNVIVGIRISVIVIAIVAATICMAVDNDASISDGVRNVAVITSLQFTVNIASQMIGGEAQLHVVVVSDRLAVGWRWRRYIANAVHTITVRHRHVVVTALRRHF